MAAELKARKDMDKRDMWDLTQIYKTNEDWEKAFVELQARIPEVGRYSGTMGTPAGAKAALDGFYDLVYKSKLHNPRACYAPHRDPAGLPSCPGAGAVPPPNSGYNPRAQACALP